MLDLVDRLCGLDRPFHLDAEREELFLAAMGQAWEHHRARCPEFDRFCRQEPLRGEGLEGFPFLFVNVFKYHELLSVPRDQVVLHVTSSGTGGQKSQTFFDQASLDRAQGMLEAVFREFGLVQPERATNYLILSYDPAEAPDLGTAFTSTNWTRFTAHGEVVYGLRKGPQGFFFDEEACREALLRFDARPEPVRVVGFPAFLHRLIRGLPRALDLGADSFILTGGGWKSYAEQEVPRQEFTALVAGRLGVPAANLRDNYGMVEHGAPYMECEHHAFHVPVFCRALVRDPVTLDPLPPGEAGMLQLLTPFLGSVPNLSLLTGDLARLEQGCPCGRKAPVLRVLGRGGVRKHAGCALTAAQLLR